MAKLIDATERDTFTTPVLFQEHVAPQWWQSLSLGAVMLISIFMNFYQLGQNGFGNTYYASAIRSMLYSVQISISRRNT